MMISRRLRPRSARAGPLDQLAHGLALAAFLEDGSAADTGPATGMCRRAAGHAEVTASSRSSAGADGKHAVAAGEGQPARAGAELTTTAGTGRRPGHAADRTPGPFGAWPIAKRVT
jgi:hypothetical protein